MVRLILMVAFIGVVAFAITAALGTIRAIASTQTGTGPGKDQEMMPAKFQRITFVLLVLLMFGVTTGWLGGV